MMLVLGSDGNRSSQRVLIDTGSNRNLVLEGFGLGSTACTTQDIRGISGTTTMKRRASIVLPNGVVGSNIEDAFEVSPQSGIMPAGCVALLGTGAIARLDIAAGKVCEETHVTSGYDIECSYNRQLLLHTANATIMGP
jgi:hypothetical protein